MSYSWHDTLGMSGVVLVLGVYLMLQMKRVTANVPWFSAANALGALLILASLSQNFNLSAFVVESAWLAISLYGLVRALTDRRKNPT